MSLRKRYLLFTTPRPKASNFSKILILMLIFDLFQPSDYIDFRKTELFAISGKTCLGYVRLLGSLKLRDTPHPFLLVPRVCRGGVDRGRTALPDALA